MMYLISFVFCLDVNAAAGDDHIYFDALFLLCCGLLNCTLAVQFCHFLASA